LRLGAAPIWPPPRPVNRRFRTSCDLSDRASRQRRSTCPVRTGSLPNPESLSTAKRSAKSTAAARPAKPPGHPTPNPRN